MIKLLVDSGANPLIENNEGRIAQDYAKDNATTRMINRLTREWRNKYLKGKQTQKGIVIKKDPNVKRATIFGM